MFGWFKPKPSPPDKLVRLLKDYPPFMPMHLGRNIPSSTSDGPVLSLAQAFENLHQYKNAIPTRLSHLRGVLASLDIDIDTAYTDPLDFVVKLHRILIVELPPLYREEFFEYHRYELLERSGDSIGLSFMSDLAMLEADVLMKAKPGCFIGLNLDKSDRAMSMYRRPCLLGLADSLFLPEPDIFCLEELWFSYFANMKNPSRLAHPDFINPEGYEDVIGGWMLILLNRYVVAPDLKKRLNTTWLRKAAGESV
jgi:hypothetical protein